MMRYALRTYLPLCLLLCIAGPRPAFGADLQAPWVAKTREAIESLVTSLQDERNQARSVSPLASHKYDEAGYAAYLGTLNRQFVGIQSLALLVNEYKARRAFVEVLEAKIDACSDLVQRQLYGAFQVLCADTLDASNTLGVSYDFADLASQIAEIWPVPASRDLARLLMVALDSKVQAVAAKEAKIEALL